MNPCRLCIKKYKDTPCEDLGHCVFENSFELELSEKVIDEDYRPTIVVV